MRLRQWGIPGIPAIITNNIEVYVRDIQKVKLYDIIRWETSSKQIVLLY